jgi:hypothetical protein
MASSSKGQVMKSSGRRVDRAVPAEREAPAVIPLRGGKSGEGAASAMEQLRLLEQARQQQQQRRPPESKLEG